MKKLLYLLPVLFLAACNGQFNAAYGGGLWFIPLALFGFSAWSAGRFVYGWKLPFEDPYFIAKKSKGAKVFAITLFIASIGSAIWMWGSRAAI